jgi:hypothetical protein
MNDIEQKLKDAWLGIDVDEDGLFNPLDYIHELAGEDKTKVPETLAWLMTRPEYFSFVCKYIFNIEISPVQALILHDMWNRKFPMLIGSRGFGKSFILSLYCMLRAFFLPERKIVVVGAAFRQSKVLFEYAENIWRNAPILRDLCDQSSGTTRDVDRCTARINRSIITFLPLGDGQKIRGQRANDIVADEFASIPREIFENVVAGFAAVASSPIDKVKARAKEKRAKELGISLEKAEDNSEFYRSNQIILSGTAYYDFNHFADYWKRYHAIVRSRGDRGKLAEVFKGEVPEDFNWRDYGVYRIPVDMLPPGFMDEGQISRARATVHAGIFQMEYGACFSTDSKGFFKRSLIESCVCSEEKPIVLGSGEVFFEAATRGNPNKKYVIGVDPASEVDNFSIVVLEVNEDHRRVVYCWTTTRERHRDTLKSNLTEENDFYGYCARKIRNLMKIFPTVEIAMDPQGGGIAVMEVLHDKNRLREGEAPIWPKINPDKPADTDGESGLHIIEMINFASAQWTAEANHSLRKDMEDKALIFPFFDVASLGLSLEEDKRNNRTHDTLEDCVMEIEDLKNELSLIVITQTANGRERWDTPDTRSGKKNKLRKDRYSSLLMANWVARNLNKEIDIVKYDEEYYKNVGFAQGFVKGDIGNDLYSGPAWFSENMTDIYNNYWN